MASRFAHIQDEPTLRASWRRLARRLHPDANPGDPAAEETFKQAHASFVRALKRIRTGVAEVRATVAEAPLSCRSCGDRFDHGLECHRCGVPLHRTGDAVAPIQDPRIDEFVAALYRTPRFDLSGIPSETWSRMAAVWLLVFGLVHLRIGMVPTGIMMLAFAGFTFAVELHHRMRRGRLNTLLSSR